MSVIQSMLWKDSVRQEKQAISRYLRLASHTKGAALFYTSTKSEVTMNRVKNFLCSLAFGNEDQTQAVLDPNKALAVPFGCDSFQLIGQVSLEAARSDVAQTFPNQEAPQFVIPDNPARDSKFAERDIDLVRGVREKELEDHRRRLELRHDNWIGLDLNGVSERRSQ